MKFDLTYMRKLLRERTMHSLLYEYMYYIPGFEENNTIKHIILATTLCRNKHLHRKITEVIDSYLKEYGRFQWPDNKRHDSYSQEMFCLIENVIRECAEPGGSYLIDNRRRIVGLEREVNQYKIIYACSDGSVAYRTTRYLSEPDVENSFFILFKLVATNKLPVISPEMFQPKHSIDEVREYYNSLKDSFKLYWEIEYNRVVFDRTDLLITKNDYATSMVRKKIAVRALANMLQSFPENIWFSVSKNVYRHLEEVSSEDIDKAEKVFPENGIFDRRSSYVLAWQRMNGTFKIQRINSKNIITEVCEDFPNVSGLLNLCAVYMKWIEDRR